jgi:hypothetical protein
MFPAGGTLRARRRRKARSGVEAIVMIDRGQRLGNQGCAGADRRRK